ncbi:Glycosyltransferase involved in cell wall bisynthesis [Candidatus Kryptonium thompsonii]|jgi:glycosyltransferase involved in cell wall biosynthesis|nr:Glycosyltransferase involved in cell wall bisynthesis [Candidatus Kryptonium thompsoni]
MPYPPKDGGSIVTLNYAKELSRLGCSVTILAMNTYKRRFKIEGIPTELRNMIKFYAVDVDTKIKPLYLLVNLFQKKSYHIWRYGSSDKFKEKLIDLLKNNKFDIVQLEGLYLAPYLSVIRENSKAKVVLRAHNIEYEILERYAEWEKSLLKKLWLKIQARRLKKYELGVLNSFDAIVAITDRDAKIFKESGCRIPIHVAPAGIEIENYNPGKDGESDSLFFIGALDWFPNQQGLEWFLKNVWSKVHEKFPDLKFYIAGRNPHLWKFSRKISKFPNVELVGEVEDARGFMKSHKIMVVPVFAGSGIRVKIIEAMALGKIIITTGIGIEGIEYEGLDNVMLANTENEFIEKISLCVKRIKIEKSYRFGTSEGMQKYDINRLSVELLKFYKELY